MVNGALKGKCWDGGLFTFARERPPLAGDVGEIPGEDGPYQENGFRFARQCCRAGS